MEIASAFELGLKSSDLEKILVIFKKYIGIEKAIIYGSRAKGNYKSYSDIDITLIGQSIDLTIQNKIENELDDLLLHINLIYHFFTKLKIKI